MPPKPTAKAPAADYSRVYKYITDPSPENAKAADVREFYRQMFKDQFLYEANAENADGYVRGRMVVELKGRHDDWLPYHRLIYVNCPASRRLSCHALLQGIAVPQPRHEAPR